MTITKHQKEIICLIKEGGFKMKYQSGYGWWIHKEYKDGYRHSIDVLQSTVKNLIDKGLIKRKRVSKHKHHYCELTNNGKQLV